MLVWHLVRPWLQRYCEMKSLMMKACKLIFDVSNGCSNYVAVSLLFSEDRICIFSYFLKITHISPISFVYFCFICNRGFMKF